MFVGPLMTLILAKIGLSKMSIKAIIVGLAVLAILAIVGLFYWHYTGLLGDLSDLRAERDRLKTAVELQDRTIAAQRSAIDEWQAHSDRLVSRMDELARVSRAARAETRRLNELFSKHDIGELAEGRPGMVEDRVNSGSDRARCLLEHASAGADPDC